MTFPADTAHFATLATTTQRAYLRECPVVEWSANGEATGEGLRALARGEVKMQVKAGKRHPARWHINPSLRALCADITMGEVSVGGQNWRLIELLEPFCWRGIVERSAHLSAADRRTLARIACDLQALTVNVTTRA